MADDFNTYAEGLNSPANNAAAITPNDGADLAKTTRGIYVGTGGHVALVLADDSAAVTFKNVAAGSVIPVRAKRVMSTNTTATDLVALW